MKKLIILFAMLFININIYALPTTYYTDYSDFEEYQEDIINTDELTRVNIERRYKFYNEAKNYGGYFIEGSNDINYPYIDYSNYKFTPISEWSYTKMDDAKNRIFDERTVYEFAEMKEVRYIHLYNVSGSYGAFRISELNVNINGVEIPYTSICNNCNQYFYDFINNGKIDENMSVVYNGGSLTIDLGNYYKLDTIDFDLYLYDIGYEPKIYNIAITRDASLNDIIYSKAVIYNYFTYNNFNEIISFNYNINNMSLTTADYYPWVETNQLLESTKTRLTRSYNLYRYQDILYSYYNIERLYSDTYMKEATEEFPFMSEEYKDYYQRSTRDKLTINEPITITSKDTDLKSFIIESTSNIEVQNNIDYTTNGNYTITYTIKDMKIDIPVTVDIPENIVIEAIEEMPTIVEQIKETETIIVPIDNQLTEEVPNNNITGDIESELVKDKITQVETSKEGVSEETKLIEDISNLEKVEELPITKKSLVAFNVGMITIILSIIMGLWIIILSMKKNSN